MICIREYLGEKDHVKHDVKLDVEKDNNGAGTITDNAAKQRGSSRSSTLCFSAFFTIFAQALMAHMSLYDRQPHLEYGVTL